jgi:hypothetical protein
MPRVEQESGNSIVSVPSTFFIGEKELPIGAIPQLFKRTLFEGTLARNTRFGDFKPKTASHERWGQLLGADVHNSHHMPQQTGLLRQMLLYHEAYLMKGGLLPADANLSVVEQREIQVTGQLHDVAESIIPDMPDPLKTTADGEAEFAILEWMIPTIFHGFDPEGIAAITKRTIHTLRHQKDDKQGRLFRTGEIVGYFRTAMAGWMQFHPDLHLDKKTRKQPTLLLDEQRGLLHLANEVMGGRVTQLIERADTYPAVDSLLIGGRTQIDHAFAHMGEFTHLLPPTVKKERGGPAQFEQAKAVWASYLKTRKIA